MATKYKSMYKYELVDAAGVSSQTFRRWLITDRAALKAMGVSVKQRLLPPNTELTFKIKSNRFNNPSNFLGSPHSLRLSFLFI